VIENVGKRARQRARVVQAEVDGRDLAEERKRAKPPFIEPAHFEAVV